jgi:hypothetical protein
MWNALEPGAQPHLLLLATQPWPTGARLGLALRAVGFRVSIWCPNGHPLLLTGAADRHYPYGTFETVESLETAIIAADPHLIVPCDDLATFRLQQLAGRALTHPHVQTHPHLDRVLGIIEQSLGAPADLNRLTSRTHVLAAAAEGGVAVPASARIASPADLRAWFSAHGFPAYLKADATSGGIGVRPVHTYQKAAAAFRSLDAPPRTLRALKRLAIDRDPTLMGPLVRRQRPAISVQRAVAGTEATSAIFCWQGQVLASISVQVLATRYERGPSTIVRRFHNAAMDRAAEVLASRLRLSGFYGLDFVLDEQTGTSWLIEMNSRATQIAHLALGGSRSSRGCIRRHHRRPGAPTPRGDNGADHRAVSAGVAARPGEPLDRGRIPRCALGRSRSDPRVCQPASRLASSADPAVLAGATPEKAAFRSTRSHHNRAAPALGQG